jgi:glucokinase
VSAILGLDFGGTKLAAGIVDSETGAVLAALRAPTPAGGAQAGIAAMFALGQQLVAHHTEPIGAVGVSFGGPVEADGRTVRLSMHIPGWEGTPLAALCEQAFAVPARIANDADAAALAEYRFGAGHGCRHMLYLTVSTGIGGGVIVDGKLHRGEHAWAGEVGHMILKPDGPPCACGGNGCLESLSSGLSIARDARARIPAALRHLAPADISARDVVAAAQAGDPDAQAIWQHAVGWLGVGISSACNLLNPGIVVLGGGLTGAGDSLFAPLREIMAYRMLGKQTVIKPAALGDVVGIIGGAALCID